MNQVPYVDLLLRLADYQRNQGSPLRFHYHLGQGGRQQVALIIHPAPDEVTGKARTLPIFTYPTAEPLDEWQSSGYIHLIHGRLDEGVFLLTPKTLELADGEQGESG